MRSLNVPRSDRSSDRNSGAGCSGNSFPTRIRLRGVISGRAENHRSMSDRAIQALSAQPSGAANQNRRPLRFRPASHAGNRCSFPRGPLSRGPEPSWPPSPLARLWLPWIAEMLRDRSDCRLQRPMGSSKAEGWWVGWMGPSIGSDDGLSCGGKAGWWGDRPPPKYASQSQFKPPRRCPGQSQTTAQICESIPEPELLQKHLMHGKLALPLAAISCY